jgi:signal transduction histidine kinase
MGGQLIRDDRIPPAKAVADEQILGDAAGTALRGRRGTAAAHSAAPEPEPRNVGFWPSRRSLLLLLIGCATAVGPLVVWPGTYYDPELRAALETMMTLFAFAAAWLFRAHFLHSRRYGDLLLAVGTAALGFANLAVSALPAALDWRTPAHLVAAGLLWQLVVGAIFAAAAFGRSRRVFPRRVVVTTAAGLILTGLLVLPVAGALLTGLLVGGSALGARALLSHPLGLLVACLAATLLIGAAVGFQRWDRPAATGTPMMLSLAAILLAAAGFYYRALGPDLTDQVTVGEALGTLAFALILAVAVREEFWLRARLARAAALTERGRVARDLHDGLAQDLAFIAAHGRKFAADMGDDNPVVIAAKRALAVSRGVISELSDPAGATTYEALEALTQELRDRFDIAIALDAHPAADVGPEVRQHLTRIAREAIANAARHGGARNIIVSLKPSHAGVALRVVDDGCGICDPGGAKAPEGFGIRSMREHADTLGGWLRVDELRRGGTELEVVVPCHSG